MTLSLSSHSRAGASIPEICSFHSEAQTTDDQVYPPVFYSFPAARCSIWSDTPYPGTVIQSSWPDCLRLSWSRLFQPPPSQALCYSN